MCVCVLYCVFCGSGGKKRTRKITRRCKHLLHEFRKRCDQCIWVPVLCNLHDLHLCDKILLDEAFVHNAHLLRQGCARTMRLFTHACRLLAREAAELGGQLAMAEENFHKMSEQVQALVPLNLSGVHLGYVQGHMITITFLSPTHLLVHTPRHARVHMRVQTQDT